MIALTITLVVKLSAYSTFVAEAARVEKVKVPLVASVEVTSWEPWLVSWVPIKPGEPPRILVTEDFLETAPTEVMRYVAYHEVCHVRLRHWEQELDPAVMHTQVEGCLQQNLGLVESARLKKLYLSYLRNVLKPSRLKMLDSR